MISKLEKESERKEYYRRFSLINIDAKFHLKISKLNQAIKKYIMPRDFPGGPVVKNPLFNAGDAGLIAGGGTKIPHAAGQLSPGATTREKPACHNEEPACPNERSCVLQLRPDAAKT